ncbi:MAG TPA: AbrB/MazE/SpoVT family DNA-binding domain-containing protein [Chloroflexota bacterium]|jgi:AbrB family looped-hinge helix DNA binding protein
MIVPTRVGETTITGKNQISLPAEGVRMLGWKRGDRLTVRVLDENTVVLTRWPKGQSAVEYFAGKLGHVFGDHDEVLRYLDEERRSWGELGRDLGTPDS